jgi:hypothetical protein
MIKWILETAFYQALKDYHARPALAYNYVRTIDLKNSILQSTGKDLTEFLMTGFMDQVIQPMISAGNRRAIRLLSKLHRRRVILP